MVKVYLFLVAPFLAVRRSSSEIVFRGCSSVAPVTSAQLRCCPRGSVTPPTGCPH